MNKNLKILIFSLLFLLMLGTTIWASLQQNLFTEFAWSGSPMWFKATIVDFYINQLILWLWVCFIEKKWPEKFIWLVLFICFGSMGTCGYILFKTFRNESLFSKETM